jgi:hypothetical protein
MLAGAGLCLGCKRSAGDESVSGRLGQSLIAHNVYYVKLDIDPQMAGSQSF